MSLYLLGSFEALEESGDSTSQNAGLVLRILPLMLGWFAMNAPSGLGLYWVFNNILTTAQVRLSPWRCWVPPRLVRTP